MRERGGGSGVREREGGRNPLVCLLAFIIISRARSFQLSYNIAIHGERGKQKESERGEKCACMCNNTHDAMHGRYCDL